MNRLYFGDNLKWLSDRKEFPDGSVDLILDLLPVIGSIPKADVIERLRDKGIGERRSRLFIAEHLAPSGPIYEWRIKRSCARDAIHLSRYPQFNTES